MDKQTNRKTKKSKEGPYDVVFNKVYDAVYNQVLDLVDDGKPDMGTVMELIKVSMEVIESIGSMQETPLSGYEKSQLAKNVIKHIIEDLAKKNLIDKDLSSMFLAGVDLFAPIIFKLVIDATLGHINVNQNQNQNQNPNNTTTGCCLLI